MTEFSEASPKRPPADPVGNASPQRREQKSAAGEKQRVPVGRCFERDFSDQPARAIFDDHLPAQGA